MQMLYHITSTPPVGKNTRGAIRRNLPRSAGLGPGGRPVVSGPYPPRSPTGSIPPPPSSQTFTSTASPGPSPGPGSNRSERMPVGTEKPTGGGDSGYSGGSYQSMGGQYQPTVGPYGLMGQPTEDDDILFVVDDNMPEIRLSKGRSSEGVVGVDKDGDGTTDDFLLFTWEG